MVSRGTGGVAAFALLAFAGPLTAQASLDQGSEPDSRPSRSGAPVLMAVPVQDGEIEIDGVASEAAWQRAPIARDFVEFQPEEGAPPSAPTEARVLYGSDALYVAFHAYDDPTEVVGQLTRRDAESYSDWVHVVVDSYFDRRTAFQFGVNPRGVKQDIYRFNDTQEDDSWDAVWHVAVAMADDGWTAEFRIPYSQLRFEAEGAQTWGINFVREIAREQEISTWAPLSRQESALVSRFGELRGIQDLTTPRRLEVLPYSVARLTRGPGDAANPFFSKNDGFGTVGADIKYGVTSNLTLDLTINPDFGQVEADPAEVNLSAFESFFSERRPFFVEGGGIFGFRLGQGDGDGSNEQLFYSRRIGRAPQGFADPQGGYADADGQTTILGAWKLSGKTASGVSVGVLHAVTAEESAQIVTGAGERMSQTIEPFTNYSVVRLQKDVREGQTAFGLIATGTNRERDAADALGLRSGAYTGGVDVRHRFGGGDWEVNGFLVGSHVRGSSDAILATQRASSRYFQRPDANHVEVDPDATSMSGWSSNFAVVKQGGGYWRVGTGYQARSPGFEANDLGFMNQTDYVNPWVWGGYHRSDPQGPFNRWNVNVNGWSSFNFDWERQALGGNVNGSFTFRNFWGGYAGVGYNAEGLTTSLLRGGPAFQREPGLNGWYGMWTDSRKPVTGGLNGWWGRRSESGSWNLGFSSNLGWRPSGSTRVSVNPFVSMQTEDRQWVGRFGEVDDTYLLGELDQTTVGITARLDMAFTPTLSLQLYAQPFVSSGEYAEFKTVTDPRGSSYAERVTLLPYGVDPETGRYTADVDGDGSLDSFRNPDFNFKQFRSNAVLRWEYRPGSALFLVWSQGRNQFVDSGDFAFGRDMGRLFDTHPENVFLVKLSYWLNP